MRKERLFLNIQLTCIVQLYTITLYSTTIQFSYIIKLYNHTIPSNSINRILNRIQPPAKGGKSMNLEKILPLTETTFYILLALRKPGHGYAVMQEVEALSGGRVRIAAGTMYGAIDNLTQQKLIEAIPSKDPRRKVYQLTFTGEQVINLEARRLEKLLEVYHSTEQKEG